MENCVGPLSKSHSLAMPFFCQRGQVFIRTVPAMSWPGNIPGVESNQVQYHTPCGAIPSIPFKFQPCDSIPPPEPKGLDFSISITQTKDTQNLKDTCMFLFKGGMSCDCDSDAVPAASQNLTASFPCIVRVQLRCIVSRSAWQGVQSDGE